MGLVRLKGAHEEQLDLKLSACFLFKGIHL